MANFDTFEQAQQDMYDAAQYLFLARQIYTNGKRMQALKARYQAGTSAVFNNAVNDLHTTAERSELGALGTSLDALLLDWETHPDALGLS